MSRSSAKTYRNSDRVTEMETKIGHVEDEVPPLQVAGERLQHQLTMVLAKQDDMENCLRRCNLRFVGLPEGAEGSDPPSFLENLLITTLGRAEFSTSFVVEMSWLIAWRPAGPDIPACFFFFSLYVCVVNCWTLVFDFKCCAGGNVVLLLGKYYMERCYYYVLVYLSGSCPWRSGVCRRCLGSPPYLGAALAACAWVRGVWDTAYRKCSP